MFEFTITLPIITKSDTLIGGSDYDTVPQFAFNINHLHVLLLHNIQKQKPDLLQSICSKSRMFSRKNSNVKSIESVSTTQKLLKLIYESPRELINSESSSASNSATTRTTIFFTFWSCR